ncbi:HAUS augmin-like complex subunit 8 isoform 3-T3 [Anomaloglossus baeobatrachus]|uniref:HAUS augmin-like complex subunit 8 isoform X3 n=1 Tax=Anomaloglossus baeobatrachus TaxID=238106 RepID=UPI003F4F6D65
MAESGSGSLESGSQNSSGGSSGDSALKKNKGPRVVKSRYMQYDKPKNTKKTNVSNTSVLSAGKSQEKSGSSTPTRRSVLPQKFKAPPDKTMQKPTPKPISEQRKPKKEANYANISPEEMVDIYESQTLLFTYLTVKMQKNIRCLEEKAERSLLLVHNEKMQLQEKVQQLKRELSLTRREEQLDDLLEKQVESLTPSTSTTTQFKDNYTSFATALDCTRHQLPMKDIHITGTRQRFLEDIQKHLGSTISLLEETTTSCATDDKDMLTTMKNLEDVVHKTDAELSQSLHQVMELSFKVNKEVCLQSQKLVEENTEMEVLKRCYFEPGSQQC